MSIYLDHNATTPVRREVLDAMLPALREGFGNPSSVHADGAAARATVTRARERVASLLGAEPEEVFFTGGATESNNTVLAGLPDLAAGRGHVVTTTVEHPSLEASLAAFEARGGCVTRARVGLDGRVRADEVIEAVREDTVLVSIIWANNETGVVQPIEEIATAARDRGITFHSDATQAVGKHPLDLARIPADLLSLSAHKLNGPKGVGCLRVRRGLAVEPYLLGGPQEGRRRGGTENVAGIAGLGMACALAEDELGARIERFTALRDRLWQGIRDKIPGVHRNGSAEHVLCNTLNVEFEGAAGEVLLQALDIEGVSVSAGAACASGSIDPSPVLVAMGRTASQARSSLRFSIGHGNDESEIDRVLGLLPDRVARARAAAGA